VGRQSRLKSGVRDSTVIVRAIIIITQFPVVIAANFPF
jgi:hypothetical protein